MRLLRVGLLVVSVCLLNTAGAQTQIHKCTDADGGVVYSQLPCVTAKPAEPAAPKPDPKPGDDAPVSVEPDLLIAEALPDEPEAAIDSSACKKRYRDAIDAIDAEIGREYSPDKAAQYKERLLHLTRKLREC